ncbi:uncharacterized protein LOC144167760 isoform X2 [Haemaphysalis longicornis]
MAKSTQNAQCEVILGISQAKKNRWMQMPSLSPVQPSEVWCVDFKISQEGTVRCETAVENDTLKGCLIVAKVGDELTPPDRQIPIGYFGFNFDRIREAFESIDNASRYDLVLNNSRTWTQKLLQTLGVAIPEITRKTRGKVCSSDKPDCEVILGFSRLVPRRRKFFSKGDSSLLSKWVFMHWLVDFKIQGGQAMRCEAGKENGQLMSSLKLGDGFSPPEHTIPSVFKRKKEDEAFEKVVSDVKCVLKNKDGGNIGQNMTPINES